MVSPAYAKMTFGTYSIFYSLKLKCHIAQNTVDPVVLLISYAFEHTHTDLYS